MIILGFFAISLLFGALMVGSSEKQIRRNRHEEHGRLMEYNRHHTSHMYHTQPMSGMYPPVYHDPYYHQHMEAQYRDRSNLAIFVVIALSIILFIFFLQWAGIITIGL